MQRQLEVCLLQEQVHQNTALLCTGLFQQLHFLQVPVYPNMSGKKDRTHQFTVSVYSQANIQHAAMRKCHLSCMHPLSHAK